MSYLGDDRGARCSSWHASRCTNKRSQMNRMELAKIQLAGSESESGSGALGADSNQEMVRRGGSGHEQTHLLESLVQAGTAKRVSFSCIASWVGCALTHCAAVGYFGLAAHPSSYNLMARTPLNRLPYTPIVVSMDLLQSILERIRQSVGCSFTTGKLLRHGRRVVRSGITL